MWMAILFLDQAEDALVIPVDALMRGNKVYVKDASATEQQGKCTGWI